MKSKYICALKGKRVEIYTKDFGTNFKNSYKGVITSFYIDQQQTFIELDEHELINTMYIAKISIID